MLVDGSSFYRHNVEKNCMFYKSYKSLHVAASLHNTSWHSYQQVNGMIISVDDADSNVWFSGT